MRAGRMTGPDPTGEAGATGACPFCAIIAGTAPARIIDDGPAALAFLPLRPATPGHTLLVPRRHVPDFLAADESCATALALAVGQVGRALREALRPDGMNVITSAGEAASQTVMHLHVHLVPRWYGDRMGGIWPDGSGDGPESTRDELVDRIRESLRRVRAS